MKTILALAFLLGAAMTTQAQAFSADELHRRAVERRAVEAVIWGMPAVNYERMLQAASANGAKLNQVVYWSRPVNAKNQTRRSLPIRTRSTSIRSTTRRKARWSWRSRPRTRTM